MSSIEEIEYLKGLGVEVNPVNQKHKNLKFSVKIDKYTFDYENGKVVRVRADSFEEPRFTSEGLLSNSFKEEIINTVVRDKKFMTTYCEIDTRKIPIETQIDRHTKQ